MKHTRFWLGVPGALALASLFSCATLGSESDVPELPSSGVGPFRKLEAKEVRGIAPFVLDNTNTEYLEPSVLPDGDGAILYATKRTGPTASEIVRTRAEDARTFYGATGHFGKAPKTVLAPALAWEGTALSRPSVLRVGSESLEVTEPFRRAILTVIDELAAGHDVAVTRLDSFVTTGQAAELLHVSRPTVVKMCDDGLLEFAQPGSHRRISLASINRFIESAAVRRAAGMAEFERTATGSDDQVVSTR